MDEEIKKQIPRVLVVDDVQINLVILQKMIESLGYIAWVADNVDKAIDVIEQELPHIIMTDLSMPGTDGYEFISILKGNTITREIPIIIISGMNSQEEKIRGFEAGAVDFIPKPFDIAEVRVRLDTHLKMYRMKQEMEHYNQKLNVMVQHQMQRVEEEQRNILYALARLTEHANVKEGYSHLENVAYNSRILAQSLALTVQYEDIISEEFVETIGIAALLHDVGKIAVPAAVLNKPDKLDAQEYELVRQHTCQGAMLIDSICLNCGENKFLNMAKEIALNHHEKWSGKGYPGGTSGAEIPLAARIVSVAGVYDVLVHEQVYRKPVSSKEAVKILQEGAGEEFDPYIIEILLKVIHQLH